MDVMLQRSDRQVVFPSALPLYNVNSKNNNNPQQQQNDPASFSSSATQGTADDVNDIYNYIHHFDAPVCGYACEEPSTHSMSNQDDTTTANRDDSEEEEDDLLSLLLKKGKLDDMIGKKNNNNGLIKNNAYSKFHHSADDVTASCTESYSTMNDSWNERSHVNFLGDDVMCLHGSTGSMSYNHESSSSLSLQQSPAKVPRGGRMMGRRHHRDALFLSSPRPNNNNNNTERSPSPPSPSQQRQSEQQQYQEQSNLQGFLSPRTPTTSKRAAVIAATAVGDAGTVAPPQAVAASPRRHGSYQSTGNCTLLKKVDEVSAEEEEENDESTTYTNSTHSRSIDDGDSDDCCCSETITTAASSTTPTVLSSRQEYDGTATSKVAAVAATTTTNHCLKKVRFGSVSVRTHRVVLDTSLGGYGMNGYGACLYPLTLDWPSSPYEKLTTAYATASYFGRNHARPLSADERRLRLARIHDCTVDEVTQRQIRAIQNQSKIVTTDMNRLLFEAKMNLLQQRPDFDDGSSPPETQRASLLSLFDYHSVDDWNLAMNESAYGATAAPAEDRALKCPVASERALLVEWKRNPSPGSKTKRTKKQTKRRPPIPEVIPENDDESSSEASIDLLEEFLSKDDQFEPVPFMDSVAAIASPRDFLGRKEKEKTILNDLFYGGSEGNCVLEVEDEDEQDVSTSNYSNGVDDDFLFDSDMQALQSFKPVPWMDSIASFQHATDNEIDNNHYSREEDHDGHEEVDADYDADLETWKANADYEPILDWKALLQQTVQKLPFTNENDISTSSSDGNNSPEEMDHLAIDCAEDVVCGDDDELAEEETWEPKPMLNLADMLAKDKDDDPCGFDAPGAVPTDHHLYWDPIDETTHTASVTCESDDVVSSDPHDKHHRLWEPPIVTAAVALDGKELHHDDCIGRPSSATTTTSENEDGTNDVCWQWNPYGDSRDDEPEVWKPTAFPDLSGLVKQYKDGKRSTKKNKSKKSEDKKNLHLVCSMSTSSSISDEIDFDDLLDDEEGGSEWKPKEFLEMEVKPLYRRNEDEAPAANETAQDPQKKSSETRSPKKKKSGGRRPLKRQFATLHLAGFGQDGDAADGEDDAKNDKICSTPKANNLSLLAAGVAAAGGGGGSSETTPSSPRRRRSHEDEDEEQKREDVLHWERMPSPLSNRKRISPIIPKNDLSIENEMMLEMVDLEEDIAGDNDDHGRDGAWKPKEIPDFTSLLRQYRGKETRASSP